MKVNFEKVDNIVIRDKDGKEIYRLKWLSIKIIDCHIKGKVLEITKMDS